MNKKIDLLKEHLPTFLVENRSIYAILSKGIHSLTEDECLQYFDTVKTCIELILDDKIAQIEREEASWSIQKIHSNLNNAK